MSEGVLSTRQPRSRWLTVWLIYVVLSNLWGAYRIYAVIRDLVDNSDPRWREPLTWALPLSVGLSLLAALGALALIFRRKIGFYVYLAAAIASALVTLFALRVGLDSLILPAIGVVITVWWVKGVE